MFGTLMLVFSTFHPICVKQYDTAGKLVYSGKLALLYSSILALATAVGALFIIPMYREQPAQAEEMRFFI